MTNITELNNTGNLTDILEYRIGESIWQIVSPILIIFGTVGNILTVFVLAQKHIRKTSSAVYLIVLALTDIAVLNTGLMRNWIITVFNWDIRHYSNVGCKVHLLLSYFCPDFSAWILVTVTIERVLMVWCPYWTRDKCSRKISALVLIIIAMFLLIYNVHMLYGVGDFYFVENNKTVFKKCGFMSKTYDTFFAKTWPLVDLAVFSLVPFLFLLFGNFLIIKKVLISRKRSRRVNPLGPNILVMKKTFISSMSVMILLLNSVFLVTSVPISAYLIGYEHWLERASLREQAVLELMWSIVNQLMYVNNAVNFILYCITGSRFRQEAKTLLCCYRH